MNSYEQKQEARRERILARADKMRSEGQRRYDSGFERLRAIPTKLRAEHFAMAHTDMVGDEEFRQGYLKALKDVEAAIAYQQTAKEK